MTDTERAERMAEALLRLVRRELEQKPKGWANIHAVLKALAVCTAAVLAGADGDPGVRRYFDDELTDTIAELVRDQRCRKGEQFVTLDEFAEALDALMTRAKGLDRGEVEAELQGQIMALREEHSPGE